MIAPTTTPGETRTPVVHRQLGCEKINPDADFITDIKYDADCHECGDKYVKRGSYVNRQFVMTVETPLRLHWGQYARWCRKCDDGRHTWSRDDFGNKVSKGKATACHCGAIRPAEERITS